MAILVVVQVVEAFGFEVVVTFFVLVVTALEVEVEFLVLVLVVLFFVVVVQVVDEVAGLIAVGAGRAVAGFEVVEGLLVVVDVGFAVELEVLLVVDELDFGVRLEDPAKVALPPAAIGVIVAFVPLPAGCSSCSSWILCHLPLWFVQLYAAAGYMFWIDTFLTYIVYGPPVTFVVPPAQLLVPEFWSGSPPAQMPSWNLDGV